VGWIGRIVGIKTQLTLSPGEEGRESEIAEAVVVML
jgi:hypothetical protein